MVRLSISAVALCTCFHLSNTCTNAFCISPLSIHHPTIGRCHDDNSFPCLYGAARYGPTTFDNEGNNNNDDHLRRDNTSDPTVSVTDHQRQSSSSSDDDDFVRTKERFRDLIMHILNAKDAQHIPRLLTKNIELILSISGQEGGGVKVIESILQDARVEEEEGEVLSYRMEEVIDIILSFAEDFVDQAVSIDENNKKLLGKILLVLSDKEKPARDREEAFDDLLENEIGSFTPGFLRHIDGECERIANAPKMTPNSSRLLDLLRMIQARVVEELGSDLGEAAQVLGQLIGYEVKSERIAVLEAGLTVRGLDFAREMLALSDEALEGFTRVGGGGADPGLVEIVEEIRDRLCRYIETEGGFQ